MKKASKNKPAEVSFEEALAELEKIATELETGKLGLSDALSRYEQGMRFLKQCHEMLNDAERRIEVLTRLDENGLATTKPFSDDSLTQQLAEQADSASDAAGGPPQADIDGPQPLF